jgi:hypothetical protein
MRRLFFAGLLAGVESGVERRGDASTNGTVMIAATTATRPRVYAYAHASMLTLRVHASTGMATTATLLAHIPRPTTTTLTGQGGVGRCLDLSSSCGHSTAGRFIGL